MNASLSSATQICPLPLYMVLFPQNTDFFFLNWSSLKHTFSITFLTISGINDPWSWLVVSRPTEKKYIRQSCGVASCGVIIKRCIKIIKEYFITPKHSWQQMLESTFIECVMNRPPSKPMRTRIPFVRPPPAPFITTGGELCFYNIIYIYMTSIIKIIFKKQYVKKYLFFVSFNVWKTLHV